MIMKLFLKIILLELWIVDWNEWYGGKNYMIVMLCMVFRLWISFMVLNIVIIEIK